ncbi:MAG: hypothetical protein H0T42_32040 [Deltaproteobacteria bacterium]|nr:hypothetical protein [Deltaproteobacteria bacterium]
MRHFLLVALPLASLLAAAGCGKTECEKYADMEWKCGNYPAKEEAITRQMAQGMCVGAKDLKDDELGLGAKFKAEAECAKKHDDCAGYKACTDAIK